VSRKARFTPSKIAFGPLRRWLFGLRSLSIRRREKYLIAAGNQSTIPQLSCPYTDRRISATGVRGWFWGKYGTFVRVKFLWNVPQQYRGDAKI